MKHFTYKRKYKAFHTSEKKEVALEAAFNPHITPAMISFLLPDRVLVFEFETEVEITLIEQMLRDIKEHLNA